MIWTLFFIANEALSGISLSNQSQSIIITGESGAGKTETTKQLLEYICFLSKKEDKIIIKINEANPLLECLGNAQTEKNYNSSRYCKFVQAYVCVDFKC